MLYDVKNGQTSLALRFKLRNSSVATGAGLTGLTSASTGLIISTIADNEATATAYTVAGSTIETITTLGTYAAPTATKCRFKEVDATNHPGLYEIQLADARFGVSNAKALTITVSGAANLAECDVVIPLRSVNPYSATSFITGVNALAPPTNWNLQAIDASGRVDVGKILGTASTGAAGYVGLDWGQVTNKTTANNLSGTLISTSQTFASSGAPTVAQIVAGVWDEPKSGHVTAGTYGLFLDTAISGRMATYTQPTGFLAATFPATVASTTNITAATGVVLSGVTHTGAVIPTVTTVGTLTTYTGNTPQTGDSYARIGAAGAGLTALGDTRIANLDAAVTTRMATYSQPTGFLAATFPLTVASTTNITAGTITTATNVTTVNGLASGAITATSIAANAITAAKVATDAIGAAQLAADAVTEIQSGLALASQIPANFTTATFASAGVFATAALANAPGGSAPSAATVAAAVWDLSTTGHTTGGTFGAAMNAAGSAGDPWSTSLPGAYSAGSAGFILGTNLDAKVSTRSTYAGADTSGTTTLLSRLTSTRATNLDNLDAAVTTRLASTAYVDPSSSLTTIASNVATVLGQTGTTGVVVASGSKTGYSLAASGLDAIPVETGVNARQALSPILASAAGVLSGAATSTIVVKGGNVATTRITATVDADGNRSAVVLALPA